MADGNSPWRKIGDLSRTQFKQGIPSNSPLVPELDSIYDAVKGYSALYKAHLEIENSWATTGNATTGGFNAQGSKDHDNGGYMRWSSWTEGAAWWKNHVLTYQPYLPTVSIADYVHVYAPKEDGNDEANYVTKIVKYANQVIPSNAGDPPVVAPTQKLVFGNVPRPPIVDRIIPDAQNWAWDNLGQRIVYGIVYHTQVGTNWGTDSWFRTLWQADGSPAGGQLGLTDFGVERRAKNKILQWNSQLGKASDGVSANRAPWANGPWQQPPGGDGWAFVAKYGVNGINRLLTAIEIDQYYDTPFTKDGLDTVIWLSAWIADQAKVPYLDYPIFPTTGLTFTYTHNELQNNKPCAGSVVIAAVVDSIIPGTKDMLQHYQTASVPAPPPVVTPPPIMYAKPVVPDFLKKYPFVQELKWNDVTLELKTDLMKATKDGVKFLQYGGATALETRPAAKTGETFPIVYTWEKDGQQWGLDPIGNRVLLANTTRVSEWTPQQVDAPASAYTAK